MPLLTIEFQEEGPCARCRRPVRTLCYSTGILVLDVELVEHKGEMMISRHECEEA